VLVKTLDREIGQAPGIAGRAILEDGRVVLLIDPLDLGCLARQISSNRAETKDQQ
jgi:chemotaxis protein histidine kinase CheA